MKDFVFKAKFGHKIGNLKLNGSKLEVMRKLEEWIQDNIDDIVAK